MCAGIPVLEGAKHAARRARDYDVIEETSMDFLPRGVTRACRPRCAKINWRAKLNMRGDGSLARKT